jgi:hypothetical protein
MGFEMPFGFRVENQKWLQRGAENGSIGDPKFYPHLGTTPEIYVLDCVGVAICLGVDDQIQKLGFVNLNQYHALMVMRLLYHIVEYTMRRCVFHLNWFQYTREGDQGVCV